jgi:NAD(P)-dependent dehydrogenase (short-subunit alcohol dehydrogenase family)
VAGHESSGGILVILVTGATGNVCGELVNVLADAGVPVRALARPAGPVRFPPGVEAVAGEDARTEMSATTPARYVDAFFDFYVRGSLDESRVLPTVQDLTGRPPRTFAQWAAAHADAFR